MTLIDTHTHLDGFARAGTLDAVLARASEAGVTEMISIGTESDDWALIRDLAVAHPGAVHFSVGLHPCCVRENWADEVAQIEAFWSGEKKPVALGECGLDRFHLPKDDAVKAEQVFAWQKAAFAAQLEIAKRLGCPLVVHSRGAFAESVARNLTFEPLPAASIMRPMMDLPFTCSSSFSTKTSALNLLVMRTIIAAGRAWMPILF